MNQIYVNKRANYGTFIDPGPATRRRRYDPSAMTDAAPPLDPAARFAGKGRRKLRLPERLATLGRARQLEDGRWVE